MALLSFGMALNDSNIGVRGPPPRPHRVLYKPGCGHGRPRTVRARRHAFWELRSSAKATLAQECKTTLARSLPDADAGYLNWDAAEDRERILRRELPAAAL